jgi:hypothetical protein
VVNVCEAVAGNRRGPRDDPLDHPAHHLDAERERNHVEQQDVLLQLARARQDVGLDGRADRHDLVGIEARVRGLSEQLRDHPAHERHARRSTDEHDVVDLLGGDAGVGERLAARVHRTLDERRIRRSNDARSIRASIGFPWSSTANVTSSACDSSRLADSAARTCRAERRAVGILDPRLTEEHRGERLVEVVAAEARVARRRHHLEHAVVELEDAHVERAATEIVDGDARAGHRLLESRRRAPQRSAR